MKDGVYLECQAGEDYGIPVIVRTVSEGISYTIIVSLDGVRVLGDTAPGVQSGTRWVPLIVMTPRRILALSVAIAAIKLRGEIDGKPQDDIVAVLDSMLEECKP